MPNSADRNPVIIVPYDPVWKNEFRRIQARMLEIAGDLIIAAEHVGSTSVEGLPAKPIIDIDLVMESYDTLPVIIERLGLHGYVHEGNMGIEGREAFRATRDDGFMPYHLYVCPKDGKGYLEHIAFRDHLRDHPDARDAYGQLKLALAEQFREDREGYGSAKTAFVQGILREAGLSEAI
ncbi:GrpB family protein ['Paenibacillus yunnanensis' Narsing Rao et al. 2020]|uniref:GrpB family protein n=1 Tax=Paenibacillus tengchongensis TaxID=2608684 RepID=UPI00124CF57A|nr:GrpB family protein [Paenibacillus tengchongensis]